MPTSKLVSALKEAQVAAESASNSGKSESEIMAHPALQNLASTLRKAGSVMSDNGCGNNVSCFGAVDKASEVSQPAEKLATAGIKAQGAIGQ